VSVEYLELVDYLAQLRSDGREIVEIESDLGLEGTRAGAQRTVEAVQGTAPERMHVVLGTRESQTFRVAEFAAYYRSVKRGFESEIDAGTAGTYPEPVEHCGVCRWEEHCIARRESDEHLSLVAMIQRSHPSKAADSLTCPSHPRATSSSTWRATRSSTTASSISLDVFLWVVLIKIKINSSRSGLPIGRLRSGRLSGSSTL
jgi:hypothetical protein